MGRPTGVPPLERTPRREQAEMIPRAIEGEPGMMVVDSTWGTVAPMELAPDVRTPGELEVIRHIEAGLPLVDSRREQFFASGTIPGAINIPHQETAMRMHELDPDGPTVFFCNGPQCAATPWALKALLDGGYPTAAILYYRDGMHDWMTLGYPVAVAGS